MKAVVQRVKGATVHGKGCGPFSLRSSARQMVLNAKR